VSAMTQDVIELLQRLASRLSAVQETLGVHLLPCLAETGPIAPMPTLERHFLFRQLFYFFDIDESIHKASTSPLLQQILNPFLQQSQKEVGSNLWDVAEVVEFCNYVGVSDVIDRQAISSIWTVFTNVTRAAFPSSAFSGCSTGVCSPRKFPRSADSLTDILDKLCDSCDTRTWRSTKAWTVDGLIRKVVLPTAVSIVERQLYFPELIDPIYSGSGEDRVDVEQQVAHARSGTAGVTIMKRI